MICPNCKCEYIRGVTHCAECDVPLVDRLQPEEPRLDEDIRLVAIWRGADPAERDEVGKTLDGAAIPFTFAEARSLLFRSNETTLEVWVNEEDQKRASRVVADLEDRLYPDESLAEEDAVFALPESDASQDDPDDAGANSDVGQEWDEDEPVSEVWAGDNEGVADTLIVCFREVGIAAHKTQDAAKWQVVVRPAQEKRAKEIVREVVDATPRD